MQRDREVVVATIREKFMSLSALFDERARRWWAATESRALGRGGDKWVSEATGIARATIRSGRRELAAGVEPGERLRQPGAGRHTLEQEQPGLGEALVISVDTKKKDLVGDFKNGGRQWQRTREPEKVLVHDFPSDAVGKAIPYGVYDMAHNEAYVSVGNDHDTPAFAVASIRRWWTKMGSPQYPEATELFITAGGSNGYCSRVWKAGLQKFVDDFGLTTWVSHFPPGTSMWNKIEHRLFCYITQNWRGRALRTFETVVQLIGHTRDQQGVARAVQARQARVPTGGRCLQSRDAELELHAHEFHGDWNYELRPRTSVEAV